MFNNGYLWMMRKKNNLTLKDVSNALGYKSSQSYWKIENGKQEPTIAQTYKLAKLYDVDSVIFFDNLFTETLN